MSSISWTQDCPANVAAFDSLMEKSIHRNRYLFRGRKFPVAELYGFPFVKRTRPRPVLYSAGESSGG
jgi:hypothetical protein